MRFKLANQKPQIGTNYSKADLHVHSVFSGALNCYFFDKIDCKESYTAPIDVYKLAKSRGMQFVTITDHNSIQGSLEIAHLADTFTSEEITTHFPEDNCITHVVALDINEEQHKEIQRCRENIYDLVDYLNRNDILHFLAHPCYSLDTKLTVEHFEKTLLLFKRIEVINGGFEIYPRNLLQNIYSSLNKNIIYRLADKHNIQPNGDEPWIKYMVAGSDDHGGVNIAIAHTTCPYSMDVSEFLSNIRQGHSTGSGYCGTPVILGHTIYSTGHNFYKSKCMSKISNSSLFANLNSKIFGDRSSGIAGFLLQVLSNNGSKQSGNVLKDFLKIQKKLAAIKKENNIDNLPELNNSLHESINTVTSKSVSRHLSDIQTAIPRLKMSPVQGISRIADELLRVTPYLAAYHELSRQQKMINDVVNRFKQPRPEDGGVAFFTDTYREVNGVAVGLKELMNYGSKNNKKFTVISASENEEYFTEHEACFKSLHTYSIPVYEEMKLYFPPALKMLRYCWKKKFNLIHVATPGVIGFMGLMIGKLLNIPVVGCYHTNVPEYAGRLTGDAITEDLLWSYFRWFYQQMETLYCPSKSTMKHLISKGIDKRILKLEPRTVDVDIYTPIKREKELYTEKLNGHTRILYVGRLSKEKDLDVLMQAFYQLSEEDSNVALIVVGDGPYRQELERTCNNGHVVLFTGYLHGEELQTIYASSDIFVFPSTTDTFGKVVLEAQASGLPAIVSDLGGPHEIIIPGETGISVPNKNPEAFKDALKYLVNHPNIRKSMSVKARKMAESKSTESIFEEYWKTGAYAS